MLYGLYKSYTWNAMPYNQSTGYLQFARNLPFLELDLGSVGTRLRGDEFLQVTHSVIWATFDAN